MIYPFWYDSPTNSLFGPVKNSPDVSRRPAACSRGNHVPFPPLEVAVLFLGRLPESGVKEDGPHDHLEVVVAPLQPGDRFDVQFVFWSHPSPF